MKLADEVLTMVHAFNAGDMRRADVRDIAARVAILEARALAAEAERDEANENRRLYYSQRLYLREAQDIARRALVEGLWECNSLRRRFERIRRLFWSTSGEVGQCDVEAIRTDAARAERELIVAELQARAAENRAAQQGAAIERQALVADEAGRRAAQLEHLAAFFQRGDHAKGGG